MDNTELRKKITELTIEIKGYYEADKNAANARVKWISKKVLNAGVNNSKLKKVYDLLMKELYGDGGLAGY